MSKKIFKGINTREVWDFRLSTAAPLLYNKGGTWVVKIHCNKTGDVLDEHDTGVPAVDKAGNRDNYDTKAIASCFEWLRTVRDEYSRDNIELRKPVVAMINAANQKAAQINEEMVDAEAKGDTDLANQKQGEVTRHLKTANAAIDAAKMNERIKGVA